METLMQQLIRHEGFRSFPYLDTTGHQTIGYGRNLDDRGITQEEALMLLRHDIDRTMEQLLDQAPWIASLDQIRREVLINMAFNMGTGIEGLMGFRRMIANIWAEDWEGASREMLDSRWAGQVGIRATELAEQMRTGERR